VPEQCQNRSAGWPRWRPWVQGVCLAGFIGLALTAHLHWRLPVGADLFLRLDPLLWVAGTVASRDWAPWAVWALGLVVGTALLGRVFCGWVCPLGTVLDATASIQRRRPARVLVPRLLAVRFLVLGTVIGAAVVGVNLAGWVDPLAMTGRLLHVLRTGPTSIAATAFAAALVLGAIGLVWLTPRFWCRAVCPLGALLSVASRLSWWRPRVSASCQACDQCQRTCPMGRGPRQHASALCLGCGRCQVACPKGQSRSNSPDLHRPGRQCRPKHNRLMPAGV